MLPTKLRMTYPSPLHVSTPPDTPPPNMATLHFPPEDPGMILVVVCVIVMLRDISKAEQILGGNTHFILVVPPQTADIVA